MKKLVLLLFISASILSAKAQQAVQFKIKYLPNRIYNMAMKMDMGMDMFIPVDSATKAKSNGVNQPIVMKMNSVSSAEIKTGPLTANKTFSVTMTTRPASTKATMNGADLPIPQNAQSAQIIKGECDADGKLHINSATGGVANEQLRQALIEMINKLQGDIKFPEKPMKVGESFTMEAPMTVPASGLNLDIVAKSIYTLISIKEDRAYFDMAISMNIDLNTQKDGVPINAKGQGDGSGKFVYSIKNNFTSNMTSDMTMNLNMVVKEQKMDMKMQMKSDIQNTIAAIKK